MNYDPGATRHMQGIYTGLHDFFGEDIFEGQVLVHANHADPSTSLVVFHDGAFRKKYKEWDKELEMPILNQGDIDTMQLIIRQKRKRK